MTAINDGVLREYTAMWRRLMESMGTGGQDGVSGMASFWRESSGKYMDRLFKGGFPAHIGPACMHQEKVDEALKQLGSLNMAALEFTAYMVLPAEAAFKQTVKEMGSGSSPEEWNAFGERMMRHMESGYQGLFTSKGYLNALDMLMASAGEARNQVMGVGEDLLTVAGVPAVREVDAISRDLYLLAKRVAALEKGADVAPL
ncbi:hypothetical protein DSLASN_41650 [Desulfoluna limicola]|uniref:Poly(3-hydroxyalkanoate) polymerase subunit PhaE n=1 Tax=Desulfoluna limicola TaxID=2810562 RepID=A0ABM7PN47_9BACT|nr:poly(R)-hydroxyalkanoic acid synthase subunit PhaE [Desulfoluna limicola]BCS98533.1 hypothetical protein DSLASN_41650 [Desulfoluna limicola]